MRVFLRPSEEWEWPWLLDRHVHSSLLELKIRGCHTSSTPFWMFWKYRLGTLSYNGKGLILWRLRTFALFVWGWKKVIKNTQWPFSEDVWHLLIKFLSLHAHSSLPKKNNRNYHISSENWTSIKYEIKVESVGALLHKKKCGTPCLACGQYKWRMENNTANRPCSN